jgi:hypothetical protein
MNIHMKPDGNILSSPPGVCPGGTSGNSPAFQRRDPGAILSSPEGTAEIKPLRQNTNQNQTITGQKLKSNRHPNSKSVAICVNLWPKFGNAMQLKASAFSPLGARQFLCVFVPRWPIFIEFSPKPLLVSPYAPTALKMNYSKLKAKKSPFFSGRFAGKYWKIRPKPSKKCRGYVGISGDIPANFLPC